MDERTEKKWARRQKLREAGRQAGIREFVKAALTTPQGRDYLWWLMELAGIGRNPYTGNALDTSFKCGELNIGQQIQAHIIEISPDGYLQMLTEKQKEQENVNREYTSLTSGAAADGNSASLDTDDEDGS